MSLGDLCGCRRPVNDDGQPIQNTSQNSLLAAIVNLISSILGLDTSNHNQSQPVPQQQQQPYQQPPYQQYPPLGHQTQQQPIPLELIASPQQPPQPPPQQSAPISYAQAAGSNNENQHPLQPVPSHHNYHQDQLPVSPPPASAPVLLPPHRLDTSPTREELSNISKAMSRLWDLDINRMLIGKDFTLNLQGGKKVYEQGDAAPDPLFSNVSTDIFITRPTFAAFYALLDNYVAEGGSAEVFTEMERQEMNKFLDAVCETPVMIYLHNYFVTRGLSSPDMEHFKQQLWLLWFATYKRVVANDSSAFEHCFVGETRAGEVIGFHNWINFVVQEKKGKVNYLGHILPRRRGTPTGTEHVLAIQLSWNGQIKPVSTMFIGVSPEFELALYTMAFLASNNDEESGIFDGTEVRIKIHRFQNRDGMRIGSCYPETVVLGKLFGDIKKGS